MPPIKSPTTTYGFDKSKVTAMPSKFDPATFEKCFISSVYAAKRTNAPRPAEPIA